MKTKIFCDGKPCLGEHLLSAVEKEAVGVFETLRIYNGKIFRLEEHLERLKESMQTSGYSFKTDFSIIRQELRNCLSEAEGEDCVLRLMLVDGKRYVFLGKRKHSRALYDKGVVIKTSAVKRSLSHAGYPEAKTSAYQNALMAVLKPEKERPYEWLFLNGAGFVTEVSIGNLFIVEKSKQGNRGVVIKTPQTDGILNGVTRRFVIECASRLGYDIEEAVLTRHVVWNAAEVFLTNTSWEILPVRKLDGRTIGRFVPGEHTQKLQREFHKGVQKECRKKF